MATAETSNWGEGPVKEATNLPIRRSLCDRLFTPFTSSAEACSNAYEKCDVIGVCRVTICCPVSPVLVCWKLMFC